MALYSQSLAIPYMQKVRSEIKNHLDLDPLHEQVKTHCRRIIADPLLLCGQEIDHKRATLDGRVFHRPEVIFTIVSMADKLPLLKECLVFAFKGALVAWERFTKMDASPQRSGLTQADKDRMYTPATNDHNEGAAGTLKRSKQRAPNATMEFHNAKAGWRRNDPRAWMEAKVTEAPELMAFVRNRVRESQAIGASRKRRNSISQTALDTASKQKKKRAKTAADKAEKKTRVDGCTPLEETSRLTNEQSLREIRVDALDLQIMWHRAQEQKILGKVTTPAYSTLKNKAAKAQAIVDAIGRRNAMVEEGLIPEFFTPPVEDSEESDDEDDAGEDDIEAQMRVENEMSIS